MRNIYFLIFIFLLMCTTYTLVEKDKEVNVNSLYSIKTDMLMSKINIQGSKLTWLTNNGLGLDLFFFLRISIKERFYQQQIKTI